MSLKYGNLDGQLAMFGTLALSTLTPNVIEHRIVVSNSGDLPCKHMLKILFWKEDTFRVGGGSV